MDIELKDLQIKIDILKLKLAYSKEYSGNDLGKEYIDMIEKHIVDDAEILLKPIINDDVSLLVIEGKSSSIPFSDNPLVLKMRLNKNIDKIFALTIYNLGCDYEKGFEYYDMIGLERKPTINPPGEKIKYPCEPRNGAIKTSCWTYPYTANSENDLYPYTVFTVIKTGNNYLVILCLSNGVLSSYLMPKFEIEMYTGKPVEIIDTSISLAIGYGDNPYEVIKKLINTVSKYTLLKPRWIKHKPEIINKLGWCSWNALQLLDLNEDNVLSIVGKLINKGVPIKWVIIDDGWQDEEVRKLKHEHIESGVISFRIIKSLTPRKDRFPNGFRELVSKLKSQGIEETGLWHTINVHWGGAYRKVFEELKSIGYIDPVLKTFIPSPDIAEAYNFYKNFLRYIRNEGFSFVKTDNQWYIKFAYSREIVPLASRNIMVSHQLAAYEHGLWILNSMAMNPENYSNMLLSNVTRVSLDYIPFWKQAAKLHILWSIYNSVLFSYISYPDYDMWMSYDPSAKLYAVASILSGGPVYLTDRDPEKINVDLIKRIVLPNGELVKVDEPSLPTLDSLFIDPYNVAKLVKIASRINEIIVIGVFNLYKDQMRIDDEIDLSSIQYPLEEEKYLYYKVFERTYGLISRNDKLKLSLDNNDCEIILICPLRNNKAIIGLNKYLLPPYPIRYQYINNTYVVKSKVDGTLLYYKDNKMFRRKIHAGELIEI